MNHKLGNVLIVEDDAQVMHLMTKYLLGEGFNIIGARDGEECLKILKVKRPDIILLDIRMPKMNGIELLKNIKSKLINKYTPVVMVSSLGEAITVNEAIKSGATDFIVKPFDLDTLKEKILEHLYSLSYELTRKILLYTKASDYSEEYATKIFGEHIAKNWSLYKTKVFGQELAILLKKPLKHEERLNLAKPEAREKVMVFVKEHEDNWLIMWPIKSSSDVEKLVRCKLKLREWKQSLITEKIESLDGVKEII